MPLRMTIFTCFAILIFACTENADQIKSRFDDQVQQIVKKNIPDKTLDVFSYTLTKQQEWVLEGETTQPELVSEIRFLADNTFGKQGYKDHFRVLPDEALGDSSFAVVIVSVTPLRRGPKHAAEILDQVLMGDVLQLLQKNRGWFQVKNEYNYIGWINKTAMARMDQKGVEEWKQSSRVQVSSLFSFVYEKPDQNALHLSDLVLNCSMKMVRKKGAWVEVQLADGETGFVPATDLIPFQGSVNPRQVKASDIILTAKSMLGIPYLWGGKSTKASDCSGFTQTVFKANGILLPRDARQQALIGKEIMAESDFNNVVPGDLLFFGSGERITHVGISLGGYDFIHQDSDVHIDSFDPSAVNFNAFRKKTLKKIKRILN